MIDIRPLGIKPRADRDGGGEMGIVLCTEAVVPPECASLMPRKTIIVPLPYAGDTRGYYVETHGYTVRELVSIIKLFAGGDYTGANSLISRLRAEYENRMKG